MVNYIPMMNIRKLLIINPTTLLFILLFMLSGFKKDILYLVLIFLTHELGHIFFSIIFRVKIISIEIFPFGGIIKLDKKINFNILKNLLLSSGGILFQLILELINFVFFKSEILAFYNFSILTLNLIPICPLDGSKIFESIISYRVSYIHSLVIGKIVGIISLVIFAYLNFKNNNFNVMIISIFILNLYKEITSISLNKKRFLLERYLNDFNLKKTIKFKKTNLNYIHLNKYTYFGIENVQSEKEILGKMFDKQGYF